jgi:hypothetical protein
MRKEGEEAKVQFVDCQHQKTIQAIPRQRVYQQQQSKDKQSWFVVYYHANLHQN